MTVLTHKKMKEKTDINRKGKTGLLKDANGTLIQIKSQLHG